MTRAVAVVSGGLDSTTLAYYLRAEGWDLTMLSVDYGQRHRKELASARRISEELGAPWLLLDLKAAGIGPILGSSALTDDDVDVPEGHYAADTMSTTVVPNRNAIFLAFAFARAAAEGADLVATAVHAGDHPVYADCRPEFIRSFEAMEAESLKGLATISLIAPFVDKTKAQIVALGARLDVPFRLTWSCYKGEEVHCGACGTCFERREAFTLAGVPDPTEYASLPVFEAP